MANQKLFEKIKHGLLSNLREDDYGNRYNIKDADSVMLFVRRADGNEEQVAFVLEHSTGFEITISFNYNEVTATRENDYSEAEEIFKVQMYEFNNGYIQPQVGEVVALLAEVLMAYAAYIAAYIKEGESDDE